MDSYVAQLRSKYGEKMGHCPPNVNYENKLKALMFRKARNGEAGFTVHFSDNAKDFQPNDTGKIFFPRNRKESICDFLKKDGCYFEEWVEHIVIDMVKIPLKNGEE